MPTVKSAKPNAFFLAFVVLNVTSCLLDALLIVLTVDRFYSPPHSTILVFVLRVGGGGEIRTRVSSRYYLPLNERTSI